MRSIVYKVASLNEVFGFRLRFSGVLRGKRGNRQGGKASKTSADHQGLLNTAKCFLLVTSPFLYGDLHYLAFCPMPTKCKGLETEMWVYVHVHFSPSEQDTAGVSAALSCSLQGSLSCIELTSPVFSSTVSTLERAPGSSL